MNARFVLGMHCAALVVALCAPCEAAGQKTGKRPPNIKKFADVWENPNRNANLTLRGDGTFAEIRRDGTIATKGVWQLTSASMGDLLHEGAKTPFKMLLFNDDVIVIQEYMKDGGSEGDGIVLYRTGYDWAGKKTNKLAADRKALGLIVGKWTHPNIQAIFEAEKQGGWIQTRKNGGEPVTAAWSACDDGSFLIEYENGAKSRAWAAQDGWLAMQSFSEDTGELKGDGMVVLRAK